MPWPTPQDYNEAVQNPATAFTDADLKAGKPELTKLGLPRPTSGKFACVYRIQNGPNSWAARCFLSEVPDQQERYNAISKHLESCGLGSLVHFKYLPHGIRVQGKAYPLIKMPWLEGVSLRTYIQRNLSRQDVLKRTAEAWIGLLSDLRKAEIAHGDLQHDNVIIVNDRIKLLDYDGMFVPSLRGKGSNELGHRNYQSPHRAAADFEVYLDNFAGWVIFVSLVALSVHPELWQKYRGGDECLIFRKEDFERPTQSSLLMELVRSPNEQVRLLASHLASLVLLAPADVPPINGQLADAADASRIRSVPENRAWWMEHTSQGASSSVQGGQVAPPRHAKSSGVAPDWIVNELPELNAIPQIAFTYKISAIRGFAGAAFSGAIIAGIVADASVLQHILMSALVAPAIAIYCYHCYHKDPHHRDRLEALGELDATKKQLSGSQSIIASMLAQQSNREAAVHSESSSFASRINARNEICRRAEVQEGEVLQKALDAIEKRRQAKAAASHADIQRLERLCANSANDWDAKISSLAAHEAQEQVSLAQKVRDGHVSACLKKHLLVHSRLAVIPRDVLRQVIASGVITAADVTYDRVTRVSGVGRVRGSALVSWRQGFEQRALQSVPQPDEKDVKEITQRYQEKRQEYANYKHDAIQKIRTDINRERAAAAASYVSLKQEDQREREGSAARLSALRRNAQWDIANLERALRDELGRIQTEILQLSDRVKAEKSRTSDLQWQVAKQEKYNTRFRDMSFGGYLRQLLGL